MRNTFHLIVHSHSVLRSLKSLLLSHDLIVAVALNIVGISLVIDLSLCGRNSCQIP